MAHASGSEAAGGSEAAADMSMQVVSSMPREAVGKQGATTWHRYVLRLEEGRQSSIEWIDAANAQKWFGAGTPMWGLVAPDSSGQPKHLFLASDIPYDFVDAETFVESLAAMLCGEMAAEGAMALVVQDCDPRRSETHQAGIRRCVE